MADPSEDNPSETPEFRHVVTDITTQALREYDDGPLTPEQQANPRYNTMQPSMSPNQLNNQNDGDMDMLDPGDENNLVVLDPNHELMKRFQNSLKKLLSRREEKLTLETRDAKYELDKTKRLREDLGVELYGLQQELAKHQSLLEREHDKYNDTNQRRKVIENELDKIRVNYRNEQKLVDDEQKKVRDLQQERDNLKLRIFYMSNAKEDIRGDIAVIRRATEKAESEKSKFEFDKQKQDLLVNRLEEKEQSLKEEVALFESQLHNQMKESKHAREALTEARMECEAIDIEKKQLMQNWTSCLIGMKRRDEAYSQMNDAIKAQRQKFDSTLSEIDSYKKSILKEQEDNERLTVQLNQRNSETSNLNKQIKLNQDKMDLLKQEYAVYSRTLKETDDTLSKTNADKNQKQSELNQYQREIEAISQEKVKLEDEIFKKMQNKLTADKAAQYTDKLRKEQIDKIREIERSLAKIDNEIAKSRLDILQTETLNERLDNDVARLHNEIEDKNRIISRSEAEIKKRVLVIEQKQGLMDIYNKKVEQLIEKAGGVELGPLELEEKNLNKEIDDLVEKIMELEQKWLREQNELVKYIKEREARTKELQEAKQEFTVLTTKKMRIEGNIESQQNTIKHVNKNLEQLRLQLEKLNKYIYREADTKANLTKSNVLIENDFVLELKEAERNSLRLQEKLENLKDNKEHLLQDLVETDEQIMMWEKRIQIAKEMKSAVDSEAGQGEISEMKFSIHRMKVRYSELMKQQEKLVRDMETAVSRRDTIVTRGDFQVKNPKVVTQGKIQRDVTDIQKKIKETSNETKKIENDIRILEEKQQELAEILEQKQKNVQTLHSQIEIKETEMEDLYRKKLENMDELLMKQDHVRFYTQLKEGRYRMSNKSEVAIEQDTLKQQDKLRSLNAIINKLNEEYPNLQTVVRRIELSVQTRLNQEDEGDK